MTARARCVSLLLAAFLTGCVTDESPLDPGGRTLGDRIDPATTSFRIPISAPAAGDGVLLDGDGLEFEASRGEVSFRAALVNTTERVLFAPLVLVITDLRPAGLEAVNPDGRTEEGAPTYDFSAEVGEDGTLAPGEMSQRKRIVISDPERLPFVLGAVLRGAPGPGLGAIGGVVFLDHNADGHRDRGEPGLPGVPLGLFVGAQPAVRTRTDAGGRYVFTGLAAGLHAVRMSAPELLTRTPNPLHVALVPDEHGHPASFLEADFACARRGEPDPEPEVVLGPLRVPASGETITGEFRLERVPRAALLLVLEIAGRGEPPLAELEAAVNGHAVATLADLPPGARALRREILPDFLRAGGNTLEVRAVPAEGAEAHLVATITRR
jgi:hypothetical protein